MAVDLFNQTDFCSVVVVQKCRNIFCKTYKVKCRWVNGKCVHKQSTFWHFITRIRGYVSDICLLMLCCWTTLLGGDSSGFSCHHLIWTNIKSKLSKNGLFTLWRKAFQQECVFVEQGHREVLRQGRIISVSTGSYRKHVLPPTKTPDLQNLLFSNLGVWPPYSSVRYIFSYLWIDAGWWMQHLGYCLLL